MPEISRFFGIIIKMYYDEHFPPHFHAEYGEFEALIRIEDFTLIKGKLPPRVLGFVMEWTAIHKDELFEEWNLACEDKPLFKIKPLD
ncbi:MAG: DUF4160 domain-containing protein [Candidatus Latescibacteria bacterium]|nr:DUF4160 domain-containing protein [Candidatus Latescibacterota bacterium]